MRQWFAPHIVRCRMEPAAGSFYDRWMQKRKLMNTSAAGKKRAQPYLSPRTAKGKGKAKGGAGPSQESPPPAFRWLAFSLQNTMPTIPEGRDVQLPLPATVAGNKFGRMRPTVQGGGFLKRLLEAESLSPCHSQSSGSPSGSPHSSAPIYFCSM